MTDCYRWAGGQEKLLRLGIKHSLQVVVLEPLFEEKNRTRRMIVEMMRALDLLGIGSALPDLPGTGESLIETENVTLEQWRTAVASAADLVKPAVLASFRGGALLDDSAPNIGIWRFSPETGARLIRDMERTKAAGGQEGLLAGNRLSEELVLGLKSASPAQIRMLRVARLESDAAEADVKFEGTPLWRRAEPDEAPALSRALAQDLAEWTRQCGAS